MHLQRVQRVAGDLLVAILGFVSCRASFMECRQLEAGIGLHFPVITMLSVALTGWILGALFSVTHPRHVFFGLSGSAAMWFVFAPKIGGLPAFVVALVGGGLGVIFYLAAQIYYDLTSPTRSIPCG